MPRMMHPKHGPFAYLKDATITIGDQEFVVKWQTGNPPDSFLTFFGKDRLLKELEETPTPPGYFKKFRGEKYTDVIKFIAEELPAWFFDSTDQRREVIWAFDVQVAMEAVRLFPQTARYARKWLNRKLKSQHFPNNFDSTWTTCVDMATQRQCLPFFEMTDTELLWLLVHELPADPQSIQRNVLSTDRLAAVWETDPERLFSTKIGERFQNTIATVDRVNEYIEEIERFITPHIDTYNSTARTKALKSELAIIRDPGIYGRNVEFGLRIRDRSNDEVVWEVIFQTFSYPQDPQRTIAIQQRPRIGYAQFGDTQDFPVPYTSHWFDDSTDDFKDKLRHLLEQHENDEGRAVQSARPSLRPWEPFVPAVRRQLCPTVSSVVSTDSGSPSPLSP